MRTVGYIPEEKEAQGLTETPTETVDQSLTDKTAEPDKPQEGKGKPKDGVDKTDPKDKGETKDGKSADAK